MKKARDRWNLLLVIGVVAVSLVPQIETLKATSLIFRTTTTTTTEEPPPEEGAETDGAALNETVSAPTTNYTGIPQIDYIHDPNLPRELNGYNLSSYPFYETVPPPEEMDFKCDGLHDGFYASVAHKCQVYHHCLYGTRYDFLCANYTAFDQKTFICHFVSEVDCVNSPKFFHRNDDLYWDNKTEAVNPKTHIKYSVYSKSTYTSPKPRVSNSLPSTPTTKANSAKQDLVQKSKKRGSITKMLNTVPAKKIDPSDTIDHQDDDYVLVAQTNKSDDKNRKRNEALYKATTSSTLPPTTRTTTTTTTTPAPPPQRNPHRPRRPPRRRPSQYDYYDDDYYPTAADDDDYYEDDRRPYESGRSRNRNAGKKRPRPHQRRPAYDDYEDERYERRPGSRTRYADDDYKDRRPYERPNKNHSRRPSEDREVSDRDREMPDRRPYDDDDRPVNRNRKNRPPEKRPSSEYDRRPYDSEERRSPRRPLRTDDRPLREDSEKPIPKENRNFRDERPPRDRSNRDDRRDALRNDRRPLRDDFYDDEEDTSYPDEKEIAKKPEPTGPSAEGLVKPVGGSLFSKPRIPPRIARPVPSTEKEKYKYVTASSTKSPAVKSQPASEEEYYDEYEDEVAPVAKPTTNTRTRSEPAEKYKPSVLRTKVQEPEPSNKRPNSYKFRRPESDQDSRKSHYHDESSYEDIEEPRSRRPSHSGRSESGDRHSMKKQPSRIEDEYYYDDEPRPKSSKEESKSIVPTRFKDDTFEDERLQSKTEKAAESSTQRPFFQRNRYSDSSRTTTTTTAKTTTPTPIVEKSKEQEDKNDNKNPYVRVVKRPFLPSRGGSPYLPRGLQPLGGKNFNKTTTTTAPTTTSTTTSTTTPTTTTTTTTTTTENVIQHDYSYESDYDVRDDKPTQYKETTSQENDQRNEQIPLSYNNKNSDSNEDRKQLFLNAQKYNKDIIREFPPTSLDIDKYSSQEKYSKNPYDRYQTFKPSPQISEPYKPTNRPFSPKIPENISIKQNLADSVENDYDVTLNDALNPTISNLPQIRNYPSPFIVPADRDYTFSRFRNSYQQQQQLQPQQQQQQPDSNQAASASYVDYQPSRPHVVGSKFDNSQRYSSAAYKPQQQQQQYQQQHQIVADSSSSGSELVSYRRAPQGFSVYSPGETNSQLRPSHVAYRQVFLGDYAQ